MLSRLFATKSDAVVEALGRSFGIIEFDPQGKILSSNQNFLKSVGYEANEIIGKHHKIFVGKDIENSLEYRTFWSSLASGHPNRGEFRRFGKGGRSIWLQASYCPVVDASGKVARIIKLASDITEAKLISSANQGLLEAVSRSQGIISFTPTGEILDANDNFLKTIGYSKSEVVGQHHRMFVTKEEADTANYRAFWERLASGAFVSQEFRRIGKGGKEVLIQAAYNPVFDVDGHVVQVTKMVFDLSERMESIGRLGEALRHLAEGDLTHSIDKPLVETMESLRGDYNEAVQKLHGSMIRVAEGSHGILQGTAEISQGGDELSKRTEQQVQSIEKSVAAVVEITATGKKAAEGATHARSVVNEAKAGAEQAGEVVRKTVEAMGNIEASAQKITQIIGAMDEIAFQTNLLALNAGVEAARAGDAGRGFAVVASEVRALAQRSADAAKEIKALISTSSTQVGEGVNLVGQTGKALEKILTQVHDINKVVLDIAAGAQTQANGLHDVNLAIAEIERSTQQNAAMVEETTAASHSMVAEARGLADIISAFKLGHGSRIDAHHGTHHRKTEGRRRLIAAE